LRTTSPGNIVSRESGLSVTDDLLRALDASWDGMAVIDVNACAVWCNRILASWVRQVNMPQAWEYLLAPDDRERARAAYRRMLASGIERFEGRLEGRGAKRMLFTLSALGERGFRGALLVAHDTRRTARGSKLEVARLREVNESRTRFVNMAAHEFSTPLTSLRLQTFLLKSGRLGPLESKQLAAADILDRNMERLVKLVQDVLDVARAGADRLVVEKETIDLADVARGAVASLEAAARHKGVQLSLELGASMDVVADSDRLTQVFVNLVQNAIKFTPTGGRVDVRVTSSDGRARIDVVDDGAGLHAEDVPRLFQPFSQGQAGRAQGVTGTGLGLSICQSIIAQHDGRIWCESQGPGRGATFSFDLPLLETDAPRASAPANVVPRRPTHERKELRLV